MEFFDKSLVSNIKKYLLKFENMKREYYRIMKSLL